MKGFVMIDLMSYKSMRRVASIDMPVLFALLVAKTYNIIKYDLFHLQRNNSSIAFSSTVEGSIGYTCSLANQTDRPHAPGRRTICS